MALVYAQRSVGSSLLRRDLSLVARRAAVGSGFVGGALALGTSVGGWAWLAAAVVAIPGVFTLAAVRQPFVVDCPACGSTLGAGLVNLPDEPVVGPSVRDLRCPACGIYLDLSAGVAREVVFSRTLDGPGYELTLDAAALDALVWGSDCLVCQAAASRSLKLLPASMGVLSGTGARLESPADPSRPSYCDRHGDGDDPLSRGLIVARHGGKVIVQLQGYGVYRRLLDANRDRVDVSVGSSAVQSPGEPEGPEEG